MTLHLTASLRVKLSNEKNNDDADLGFALRQALVDSDFIFALGRKFTKLRIEVRNIRPMEQGTFNYSFLRLDHTSIQNPHLVGPVKP